MIRPTRRTSQVFVLLLLTLALTGCDVKEEIDAAISLKEMAFINLSPELVKKLVLPATCLIPLALIGGIMALVSDNWKKVGTIVGVMLGIGLLSYIIPSIETLGLKLWPEELSLTWIGGLMGWEFPIPKGDANPVTFMWALSFTVTWPLVHAAWQFALVVALIFTVIAAAIVWSWRPLAVAFAAILGWMVAPRALATVILVITSIKPEGAIASTLIMFNLIYIFSAGLTLLISYVLPPVLVWQFLPDEEPWWGRRKKEEDAVETESEDGGNNHSSDDLPALPPPSDDNYRDEDNDLDPDSGPSTGGSSPSEDLDVYHPDPTAEVIEGAFSPDKKDGKFASSEDDLLPEDEAIQGDVLGASDHESDLLPASEQSSDHDDSDELPDVESTDEPPPVAEVPSEDGEKVGASDDESDLLPVEITADVQLTADDAGLSDDETPVEKFRRLISESGMEG